MKQIAFVGFGHTLLSMKTSACEANPTPFFLYTLQALSSLEPRADCSSKKESKWFFLCIL